MNRSELIEQLVKYDVEKIINGILANNPLTKCDLNDLVCNNKEWEYADLSVLQLRGEIQGRKKIAKKYNQADIKKTKKLIKELKAIQKRLDDG